MDQMCVDKKVHHTAASLIALKQRRARESLSEHETKELDILYTQTWNSLLLAPITEWHGSGYNVPVMELDWELHFAHVKDLLWPEQYSPRYLCGLPYVLTLRLLASGLTPFIRRTDRCKLELRCAVVDSEFERLGDLSVHRNEGFSQSKLVANVCSRKSDATQPGSDVE